MVAPPQETEDFSSFVGNASFPSSPEAAADAFIETLLWVLLSTAGLALVHKLGQVAVHRLTGIKEEDLPEDVQFPIYEIDSVMACWTPLVHAYTMAFAYNVGRGERIGLTVVLPMLLLTCFQVPWLVFQLYSVEKNIKDEPNARFVETNGQAIATITRPDYDGDCSESSCCDQLLQWFTYVFDVCMKCAIRGRWVVPEGAENPAYVEVAHAAIAITHAAIAITHSALTMRFE